LLGLGDAFLPVVVFHGVCQILDPIQVLMLQRQQASQEILGSALAWKA
jgi:hypothetical protein